MQVQSLTVEGILNYLSEAKGDKVQLLPYIKSCFGQPEKGAQPLYKNRPASKLIKGVLSDLVATTEWSLVGDGYKTLGNIYYPDGKTETHYYDIDSVPLFAEKRPKDAAKK